MIEHEIKKIIQAAEMIKGQIPELVEVMMILGTGLGGFVNFFYLVFNHGYGFTPYQGCSEWMA